MSVGLLYFELDLDTTKFVKQQNDLQQKIKNVAQETNTALQLGYQNLGVKADAFYQLQANLAIKSYERITQAAKQSADEQFRAQSSMVAKINSINAEMTKNPLYEQMGIRSMAAINESKAAVLRNYEVLKTAAAGNATEIVRIERAKNEKLKELNKEMTGSHEMSMASMMRGVLRLYAAYYVFQMAVQLLAVPFKKGFEAVEEYNKSVASLAAMVVTFSERVKGDTLADQWKSALAYSTAMVPILENIAAKTLLSGQETTALANAFARSGVFLNANNATQIEAFTRISNALPLMTQGQEIMRQINTEIRSVLTGSNEQSSMMLQTLKAIDPQIADHLRIWRAEGTVLEHIGEMLVGFGPATQLLENQWQAVKTTIDTTATQILRGVMKPAYEEIINLTKELNKYLVKNKDAFIEQGEVMRKNFEVMKQWMPYLKTAWDIFTSGSPYGTKESPMARFTSEHKSELNAAPAPPKGLPLQPTKEEIAAAKKAADDLEKHIEKNLDDLYKSWGIYYDNRDKLLKEHAKANEDYEKESAKATVKIWSDATKDAIDEMEKRIALGMKQTQDSLDRPEKEAKDAREMVTFYNEIMGMEDEYRAAKLDWIQKEANAKFQGMDKELLKTKWVEEQKRKLDQETYEAKSKNVSSALGDMSSAFQAIGSMYDKSSAEYARMQEAAKAMIVLQQGVAVANAVAAIANQGLGDPYTAFARIAAMVAAMGALLASTGMSLGGGSSVASAPAYGQNTTLLGGANDQGSQSIAKSWELMQDTYDMQDTKLSGIYNEMKDLNQNITGLVTGIVRNYGAFTGIQTTETVNQISPFISSIAEKVGLYSLFEKIFGNLGTRLFNSIDSMLFGGSKTSSTASGLSIAGGGKEVRSYTDILKETSWSVFGGAGHDERSTVWGAIDEELTALFSGPEGIYTNLTKTFGELARGFGTDTNTALGYIFADAKLNLQGLDAEGVQKAVSEFISRTGDEAVKSLFGTLISKYQQVGEGLLQTAVRLVVEKESVLSALEMTNKAFHGTAMEAVALSEELIKIAGGLDKLQEAASTYYDKFFSDAEKQVRLQSQIAEALGAVPSSRADYRKLLESLNLNNEADQKRYILMLQLADAADQYYTALGDVLNAQDKLTESLLNQHKSITQWLSDLNRSALAPSNSMQSVQSEYDRLKGIANRTGASESDTSNYLNYAKEYLDYMRKYGGDYKAIYAGVVSDVGVLKSGIDLQLDIAQKQLDELKLIQTNTAATVATTAAASPAATTAAVEATKVTLTDGTKVTQAEYDALPWRYKNQYGQEYDPHQNHNPSWETIQFKASGGYANSPSIFGERGGEWAVPTYEPQRKNFLKSAPQAFWDNLGLNGGSNGPGGEMVVHVHVEIDGREIGKVVTKQIPRDGDLASAIRSVQ